MTYEDDKHSLPTEILLEDIVTEVINAHRAILSSEPLEKTINHAFEKVGHATRVDRVYLFSVDDAGAGGSGIDEGGAGAPGDGGAGAPRDGGIDDGAPRDGGGGAFRDAGAGAPRNGGPGAPYTATIEYEWVATGVRPQINEPDLRRIPLRESGFDRWVDTFLSYKPIYGNISEFPESERPPLEVQDIRSLLILPVFVAGALRGFVGFDDCTHERQWTDAELELLFVLAITLGFALDSETDTRVDRSTKYCLNFIAGLLKAQSCTLGETPMEQLIERTRTRLSIVVDTHRVLATEDTEDMVNLRQLLTYLSDRFNAIRELGITEGGHRETAIEVEPLSLKVDDAMILVMIIAEVMAVVDHRESRETPTKVTITLRRSSHNGHLVIAADDAAGVPSESQAPLDAMALLMIRQLVDSLNGTQMFRKAQGIMFRLVFPVPR